MHTTGEGAPGREDYLRLLLRASDVLATSLHYGQTIANICDIAVESVADLCILDLYSEDGRIELRSAAHRDPSRAATVRAAGVFLQERRYGREHSVLGVLGTGIPLLIEEVDDAERERLSVSEEHHAFMKAMQYGSMMIVPIVSPEGIVGTLTLVLARTSPWRYDRESLNFAMALGRRVGVAVSNSRNYANTLWSANVLQNAALPAALPRIEGVELHAFYEPGRRQGTVGGDWYDAFELPDGRIVISVGDAIGHGYEAALLMVKLRIGIRFLARVAPEPAEILANLDNVMTSEAPEQLATSIVAILDPRRRTLTGSAAAHPGPLVALARGEVIDPFTHRGLPLGIRALGAASAPEIDDELTLDPGSLICFFTDGLTEWDRDYLTGEDALRAALLDPAVASAPDPAAAIKERVVLGDHSDDIAILTIRLAGDP